MAVKIGHAKGDENGNARGGEAGDQTGREVMIQNWYIREGGWTVYLEPTDEEIAARAVANMIEICNDNSFGYDQDQRWTAWAAIKSAGDIADAAPSEVDCSSVVDIAYLLAGLNVDRGYTGNLERRYLATGKFVAHREEKYLTSADYAKAGGLYLTPGKHVAMVLNDGPRLEAAETTAEDYASEADQIDPPYVQIKGKVNVRNPAGLGGKVIYVARDEKLPFEEFDDDTGWYGVDCPKGMGFVSCDIPRYAKLVKE